MRGTAFALAILSSIFSAVEARAEKTAMVTVMMPAVKGYVLSVDLPKTGTAEKWRRSIYPGQGEVSISFYSRSSSFNLTFRVYDKPASFERYVNYWHRLIKTNRLKIYDKGFNNALGRKTFFYLSSYRTMNRDGTYTKVTKPTGKTYQTAFDKRLMLWFSVNVGPRRPLAPTESLLLFERIARSIKVTQASAMAPGQPSRYYSSPNIRLFQRRNYHLDAALTVKLPPGWAARVVAAEPASRSSERGRVVVEVTPSRKSLAGRYQKLTFVLQGLSLPKAFTRAGFLGTAKAHVASALPNPRRIETPKGIVLPGGHGFWNTLRPGERRDTETGRFDVGTYAGKDRNGRDRKVRIYTVGRASMACNIIYAADPKTFDDQQESIGAIVKSLRIETGSLVLGVP